MQRSESIRHAADDSTQAQTFEPQDYRSIARIADEYGADLLLCKPEDKSPKWKGWQRLRPSVNQVAAHLSDGGLLGVILASLRSSVLDIDYGDPSQLLAEFPPWASLRTTRGFHAYYDDNTTRKNGNWAARGCSGQVRSGRGGYVILHGGCAPLLDALDTRAGLLRPFPADLFEAVGLAPVALDVRSPVVRPTLPRIVLPLERIHPGGRGIALFDQVRFWAYTQPRGQDLSGWHRKVLSYSRSQNTRFPLPVTDGRVRGCSKSVSDWTWKGGGPLDHSYEAQARRGKASAAVRRFTISDRDRLFVSRLDAGQSTRAIASRYGVAHSTVVRARVRLTRRRRLPLGGART